MTERKEQRKIGVLRDNEYFVRIGRLWIGDVLISNFHDPTDDDFSVSFKTDKRYARSHSMMEITLLSKYFDVSIYETSYRELSMDELGQKIRQYKEGKKNE